MKKLLALAILMAMPVGSSIACTPASPDTELVSQAQGAALGAASKSRITEDAQRIVLVKIEKTLWGKFSSSVEAKSPCGVPIIDGERVVVVRMEKRLYVYSADLYERVFISHRKPGR